MHIMHVNAVNFEGNCTISIHFNHTADGTLINHTMCLCGYKPTPTDKEVHLDAFFYIVVVIVFYATSIVLLLVKYARSDDEEKNLNYQYSEYVKRDKFQAPLYKNSIALERTKTVLQLLEDGSDLRSNCPTITITRCADLSNEIEDADNIMVYKTDVAYHVEAKADVLEDGTNIVINSNGDTWGKFERNDHTLEISEHSNNDNNDTRFKLFGDSFRQAPQQRSEINDRSYEVLSLSYDSVVIYLREMDRLNNCEWKEEETVMYQYAEDYFDVCHDKCHSI